MGVTPFFGVPAKTYGRKLATGDMTYDELTDKIARDSIPMNLMAALLPGTTLFSKMAANQYDANIDAVATEAAKYGAVSEDAQKLYAAATENKADSFSGYPTFATTAREAQPLKTAKSAAAGSRVTQSARSGSALSRATITSATAEAIKRTSLYGK